MKFGGWQTAAPWDFRFKENARIKIDPGMF
jgi:hypothetical protein